LTQIDRNKIGLPNDLASLEQALRRYVDERASHLNACRKAIHDQENTIETLLGSLTPLYTTLQKRVHTAPSQTNLEQEATCSLFSPLLDVSTTPQIDFNRTDHRCSIGRTGPFPLLCGERDSRDLLVQSSR
jgi:hypothetical protein